jgi:hypothetical protein
MESLRIWEPLRRQLQLKWDCAEEDFLAYIQRIGAGGGSSSALPVGPLGHDSHRVCELVGGLSKRLVLSGDRDGRLAWEETRAL